MRLVVENFRAIKSQTIELAPFTILYGPTAAGKSSLLYALACFRNVVLNPAQQTSGFFNLGSINLGDFEGVVFDHQKQGKILLRIEAPEIAKGLSYAVTLSHDRGHFELDVGEPYDFAMSLEPSFPYPAHQTVAYQLPNNGGEVTWNGIAATVQASGAGEPLAAANRLAERLNRCTEFIRRIDLVPLVRGFLKPYYSVVALTPTAAGEDQIATYLATNKYVRNKVSLLLERIIDRELHYSSTPGTALFSLDCVDRRARTSTELVNEGFGVNQLAYLLTHVLRPESETLCIEEPEVHLHPSAVRGLARALIALTREEKKRFVLTTHSEGMLWSIAAAVKEGLISAAEVACYFVHKDRRETLFERQELNQSGQIEGGLRSFIEAELEDWKELLGVTSESGEGEDAGTADRGK